MVSFPWRLSLSASSSRKAAKSLPTSYFRRLSLSLYIGRHARRDATTSRYLRTNDVRRHFITSTKHLSQPKVTISRTNARRRDVLSRIIIAIIAFLYEDAQWQEKPFLSSSPRWIAPVIAKLRHGTESRRLSREGERRREEERISRKHVFVL